MSGLVVSEIIHFSIALILFLIFLKFYKPFTASFAFLFGFLIDADHLFDYFYYLIKFDKPFNPPVFFTPEPFIASQKVFIPLHGWEWALLLLVLALVFRLEVFKKDFWKRLSNILIVSGISLFAHLVTDYFTNGMYLASYSFFWRLLNDFDSAGICKR